MSNTENRKNISDYSENIADYDSDLNQFEFKSLYDEKNWNDLSAICKRCSNFKDIRIMDEAIRQDTTHVRQLAIQCESELGDFIIRNRQRIPALQKYPYVIGREYFVFGNRSDIGKGDLLFTDGLGHYLIVEIKFLPHCTSLNGKKHNKEKRHEVEEQAEKYAHCLATHISQKQIEYVSITNLNWKCIFP